MAKYLNTIHSIISDHIVISNRIICTLMRSKYRQYSSNTQNYHDNNSLLEKDCIEQKQERLLKVAIIGVPNAGKSSIINSIVKRNVSIFHFAILKNINNLL